MQVYQKARYVLRKKNAKNESHMEMQYFTYEFDDHWKVMGQEIISFYLKDNELSADLHFMNVHFCSVVIKQEFAD